MVLIIIMINDHTWYLSFLLLMQDFQILRIQICSLSHSIWEILHHTEFFTQASPLVPVTNISYDHDHDHHDNDPDHHDNWNKLFLCLRPIKLLSQLDRPFAQLTRHPIIIIILMHHNHHTPPSSSWLLSSKLDANFNLKPLQFYSQLANLAGGSDKLLQLSSDLILFAFTHRDKQVGHTSAKSSHFQIEDSLPFQSIMNAKELSYYKKPGKKKTFFGGQTAWLECSLF